MQIASERSFLFVNISARGVPARKQRNQLNSTPFRRISKDSRTSDPDKVGESGIPFVKWLLTVFNFKDLNGSNCIILFVILLKKF